MDMAPFMDGLPLDFASEGGAPPSLEGDFYREPDDAVRGVTLYTGDMGDLYQGDHACNKDFFGLMDQPQELLGKNHGLTCWKAEFGQAPEAPEFPEGATAPALPEDTLFRLEVTTFESDLAPDEIGNKLLQIFNQAAASVKKVNYKKFSIKVDAHMQGVPCGLKVRVYRQEAVHAIEFQRRSGDSIVFNRLYQQVKQLFSSGTCLTISQIERENVFPSMDTLFGLPPHCLKGYEDHGSAFLGDELMENAWDMRGLAL